MSHQTRIPPIKITLERELFNRLLSLLDFNEKLQMEDENLSLIASKLKNKLLTYSIPRIGEEDIEFVDIRFFPSEASNIIWQLFLRTEKINNNEDYFTILINNREESKNKFKENN